MSKSIHLQGSSVLCESKKKWPTLCPLWKILHKDTSLNSEFTKLTVPCFQSYFIRKLCSKLCLLCFIKYNIPRAVMPWALDSSIRTGVKLANWRVQHCKSVCSTRVSVLIDVEVRTWYGKALYGHLFCALNSLCDQLYLSVYFIMHQ